MYAFETKGSSKCVNYVTSEQEYILIVGINNLSCIIYNSIKFLEWITKKLKRGKYIVWEK